MSGTAVSALKRHITRVLLCLNVSAYIYAYTCVTAKSQLPKRPVFYIKLDFVF